MGRSANPWTDVIDSPDGKRYAGEFYENERSGFGVFVNQNSKDLKSFKGFYKNDLPNGLGEAEYIDGSIYKVVHGDPGIPLHIDLRVMSNTLSLPIFRVIGHLAIGPVMESCSILIIRIIWVDG